MGFTTPCFIHKNTPILQERLKNLGYLSLDNDNDKRDGLVADRNGFMYSIFEKNVLGSTYNCGINEELFLAIAALRDDTDDSQWFTDGEDWFLCQYLKVGMHYQDKPEILFDKWHKASVDELIEHFKQ